GGWQAMHIGLANLDRFAWVGSFSGAADVDKLKPALSDPAGTNAKLKLLWVACGKDDFLLSRNESLVKSLAAQDIRHQWLLTEGDHSWPVWRIYLSDFAPLLFQDAKF
ncbi:MAG: alpha/beta hydrolase, partial [Planctomycetaceae bacterium]